jgi:LmbE family N-acetylglucosaminyl deacetylase
MKKLSLAFVRTSVLILHLAGLAMAQAPAAPSPAAFAPPRVLIVVAHPDDESCFAATVYEITHNMGGKVDQLVITNGEGGFHYSLLAESIYGVALTDEAVGRAALPEIRKRELMDAGRILGISNHFFLDELDLRYTQDIDEVLGQHWRKGVVLPEVQRRVAGGSYDFVFTLFPSPETHGGHKAATLTALSAVQQIGGSKPVVLGCQVVRSGATQPLSWVGFQSAEHPFRVLPEVFTVDRTVKFGYKNTLDYQIIVNWMIAAHKSQGAFQAAMGRGEREQFVVLESGADNETERANALFHTLSERAAHPKGVTANPTDEIGKH